MRLFVTGGSGMVGRNIIERASMTDHEIIAPTSTDVDLSNINRIADVLSEVKPDFVIHCAGQVGGIEANIASPYDFCYQNLLMGMNVIGASKKVGVTKLINLGSSCMYPRNASNPLSEQLILSGELEPTNEGYAVAKIAVSRLASYASEQYGLKYKTYIPCNLYGYWDKFEVDRSHMIPAVIRKISEAVDRGEKVVEVWGSGEARREFMFAADLADFIFNTIDDFDQIPQSINIGCGQDYSINEYYKAVGKAVGFHGEFKHDLSKPEGMKQKLVDISNQKKLGWMPPTNLMRGIELTHQYYINEVI